MIALAAPGRSQTAGGWILAAIAIFMASALWHVIGPDNTDISWLLTVGERILQGAVPYRDIIETNPPGSILLYMPALLAAKATGLRPEVLVSLMGLVACAASIALCDRILAGFPRRDASGPLLCIAVAVLVMLPANSFGQREHFIFVGLLPVLACLAVRVGGGHPGYIAGLAAGITGGIVLAIKPYYGLGLASALPCLLAARALSDHDVARKPLSIVRHYAFVCREPLIAAGLALVLGVLQLAAFPDFTHAILPLLSRVYLPSRLPIFDLLRLPWCMTVLAALAVYGAVRINTRPATPVADIAASAALGFLAAFLAQGKGWPYHLYPAAAASLIGLGALHAGSVSAGGRRRVIDSNMIEYDVVQKPVPTFRHHALAATTLIIFASAVFSFDWHQDTASEAAGLTEALTRLPSRPRIMSLSSDIAVGHPLTRAVGGRWVGRLMSSWISLYVNRLAPTAEARHAFEPELRFEEDILAGDIRDGHPDAILASAPGWAGWIKTEPQVSQALQAYRLVGTFGTTMLFTRRDT